MLGAGVVVESGAHVVRSVVLDGARLGPAAEAVDAVIGRGALLEAEATADRPERDRRRRGGGGRLEALGRPRAAAGGAGVRALVTGGAGFIASTLADRLLAEGWEVDVVDDLSTGTLGNLADARARSGHHFTFHRLDIRERAISDLIVRRKPDVVFHLAAQASVRVSVDRPAFDAEVNILGTLNICEGALAAGVTKVVFAGSGGTLYGVPEHLPVREGHPQAPLAPYGVSKKAVGDYLHYYREVRGLEYTVLALANVYGPRQDPHGEAGVIAIFAGLLLERERPTIFGDGEQTRDFVYVDDVVDAFVRAVEKGGGLHRSTSAPASRRPCSSSSTPWRV